MKKIFLILVILLSIIRVFSQTATYNDVLANKKGTYTEFISSTNESFKVGDTLTIGLPFRNENFDYIYQNAGIAFYPIPSNASGSRVLIKKIQISKKVLFVNTTKPNGYVYGLLITNFEEAIKQGEIKTSFLNSEEALKQLKAEKDKLDLGIITQEQYDIKKAELVKYIK